MRAPSARVKPNAPHVASDAPAVAGMQAPVRGPPGGRAAGGSVVSLYSPLVDRRSSMGCVFEVVETLVLTLVIFFVIQTFIAQPYQVQQQSMEQTLEPGQYVLVDKLTPRFDAYDRGDVVVFNPPATWTNDDTPFIKRVIGVAGRHRGGPGRRARLRQRHRARRALHLQERRGRPEPTEAGTDQNSWVVPTASCSSWATTASARRTRACSARSRSGNVIGRAFLRYWPISTFGRPPDPDVPRPAAGHLLTPGPRIAR